MRRSWYLAHLSVEGWKFVGGHSRSSSNWLSVLECVTWDSVRKFILLIDEDTKQPLIEINGKWEKKLMETIVKKDFKPMDMVSLLHEVHLFNESVLVPHMRRVLEREQTAERGLTSESQNTELRNSQIPESDDHTDLITGLNEVGSERVDRQLFPAIQFVCSWNEAVSGLRNTPIDAEAHESKLLARVGAKATGQTTRNLLWKSIGYTGLFVLPKVLRSLEVQQLRTHYGHSRPGEACTDSSSGMDNPALTDSRADFFSRYSVVFWDNLRDGFLARLRVSQKKSADPNIVNFYQSLRRQYKDVLGSLDIAFLPKLKSDEMIYHCMCQVTSAAVAAAISPYLESDAGLDLESLLLWLLHSEESFLLVPVVEVLMDRQKAQSFAMNDAIADTGLRDIIVSISHSIVACYPQADRSGQQSDASSLDAAKDLRAKLFYPQVVFDSLHPVSLGDQPMAEIQQLNSEAPVMVTAANDRSVEIFMREYFRIFKAMLPPNLASQPEWRKKMIITHLLRAVQTASLPQPQGWRLRHLVYKCVLSGVGESDNIMKAETDSRRVYCGIPLVLTTAAEANSNPSTSTTAANSNPSTSTTAANSNPSTSTIAANSNPSTSTIAANSNPSTSITAASSNPSTSITAANSNPSNSTTAANSNPSTSTTAALAKRSTSTTAALANKSTSTTAALANRSTTTTAAVAKKNTSTTAALTNRSTSTTAAVAKKSTSTTAALSNRNSSTTATLAKRSTSTTAALPNRNPPGIAIAASRNSSTTTVAKKNLSTTAIAASKNVGNRNLYDHP